MPEDGLAIADDRIGRRTAHTYVSAVILAGGFVVAIASRSLIANPPDLRWYVLLVLTAVGGSLTLRMPDVPISFSISDAFTFTIALLFGPAAAVIAVAIDAALISARLMRSQRSFRRIAFNISGAALAMMLSATSFFRVTGVQPFAFHAGVITDHLGALAFFAGVYFAFNTALIALAIALDRRDRAWKIWREHFLPLWHSYFGGAAAAALTLLLVRSSDIRVFALVAAIPLLSYAMFKTAIARMHDQVAHLNRVNSMHLATIETLAQAIDARDQVTHDHIRRVQKLAMRLASELGIRDERELRALEAASLLHDMGKLAVPEHILNKPDKLTPNEYERMKMHASIGADILASIDFPFPVVPIVRHHHENWDGTGYPAGLGGEQIPVGARILSVVDCFDALTSDRPYRPALPAADALQVLVDRSGTMYDPAIVSAFVRIKDTFAEGRRPPSRAHVLGVIARAREGGAVERAPSLPSLTRDFIATAAEFGQMAGRAHDLETMCREVQARLAAILPDITLVIYQYDARRDRLFVRHASGPYEDAIQDLTIPLGSRVSGWVAAHRSTIVNSEAALDLGHLTTTLSPTPQLCVSAPLAIGSYVVGAFTIYSPSSRPVGSNEAILIETLASLVAPIVRDSRRCRRSEADGLDESDPSLASDQREAVQFRTARSHFDRVRAG